MRLGPRVACLTDFSAMREAAAGWTAAVALGGRLHSTYTGVFQSHVQVSHGQSINGLVELGPYPVIRKIGLPNRDKTLDCFIALAVKRLKLVDLFCLLVFSLLFTHRV